MANKNPVWSVLEATPHKDYTITLKFNDGTTRLYDAKPLLEIPLYEKLKNPGFFIQAKADCGTVIWNDDIDIAPEHLYETSKIIAINQAV